MGKKQKPLFAWIASYPKSGNTWVRLFINAAIKQKSPSKSKHREQDDDDVLDINRLHDSAISSSRELIEHYLGFDTSDLDFAEIDALRPYAYRQISRLLNDNAYLKIHDAYSYLKDGQPLLPAADNVRVLYLLRNPFDVAISFANHSSIPIDQSVEVLNHADHCLSDNIYALNAQLRQKLWSWSDHVASWTNAGIEHFLALRYEDMKRRPLASFSKINDLFQLGLNKTEIKEILKDIRMERLQSLEDKHGFREKAQGVDRFFRKGVVGDWQNTLSKSQVSSLQQSHRRVMQAMGYLDNKGEPTKLILP